MCDRRPAAGAAREVILQIFGKQKTQNTLIWCNAIRNLLHQKAIEAGHADATHESNIMFRIVKELRAYEGKPLPLFLTQEGKPIQTPKESAERRQEKLAEQQLGKVLDVDTFIHSQRAV